MREKKVARYSQWERRAFDDYRMMIGDGTEETFGQCWGLGRAWRVLEALLKASSAAFMVNGGGDSLVVAGRECLGRHLGDFPGPRRNDAVAASERLQQAVFDGVFPAVRTP